jgi:hypothetical protein
VLTLDFAGEIFDVPTDSPFRIGREGDLAVDDNLYLHRRLLELRFEPPLWWLTNVGSQISVTVSDASSGVHAWLAPGGRMPIVFAATKIRFTAGPTSYELDAVLSDAPYDFVTTASADDGSTTVGRLVLTPDQKLMLVVLAEAALRRGVPGAAEIPSAAAAARRLGWTQKKFEKKLDNVCDRLTSHGVRGLKGDLGNQAVSRRGRLVEYALATGIVTATDLDLLRPRDHAV